MGPLIVSVTMNRRPETEAMLASLEDTTNHLVGCEVVIMDNGSDNGTVAMICQWLTHRKVMGGRVAFHPLPGNMGCPRALNLAIRWHRKPGQPVVKLDNDVRILTPDWLERAPQLIAGREELGRRVAMVSAMYDGLLEGRSQNRWQWEGLDVHEIYPVIGHAVWHAGWFMDEVGYFDVLHQDHIYGFEDLILSAKAHMMGAEILAWEGWKIENLQRHGALPREVRDKHVEAMRPLYEERKAVILAGGSLRTGEDGNPIEEGR